MVGQFGHVDNMAVGHAFIERIECEARQSSPFAWTLGGVWRCLMNEEIWQRVQLVWDRRRWDGIRT
jgi:hypothetical protein